MPPKNKQPYTSLLNTARAELKTKLREWKAVTARWDELQRDIPQLVNTIGALEQQLGLPASERPKMLKSPVPDLLRTTKPIALSKPQSVEEILQNVRSREIDPAMGSILAPTSADGQQLAPDLDSIPGIGDDAL